MPLQPITLTEALVERIIALYNTAERDLLTQMADRLRQGITDASWQERQLLEIQRYRREAQTVVEKLRADRHSVTSETVRTAANRGAAAAIADLIPAGAATAGTMTVVDVWSVTALAAELNRDFDRADSTILRSVDDIYRRVIASATNQALLGTVTRQQGADRAFRRLAANGVNAFTDRAGRKWEMRSYIESATRASLMNASIEGHTAELAAHGYTLVVVSDVPQECKLCRPWEGRVLTTDDDPRYPTLGSARRAGLFHPGCRHSTAIYLPGRTRSFGETADPSGDRARQKLRYLERQVRAAKREELAALTPEGGKAARAKARAYQAKIREHVAATSAKRQPHRERLHTAR